MLMPQMQQYNALTQSPTMKATQYIGGNAIQGAIPSVGATQYIGGGIVNGQQNTVSQNALQQTYQPRVQRIDDAGNLMYDENNQPIYETQAEQPKENSFLTGNFGDNFHGQAIYDAAKGKISPEDFALIANKAKMDEMSRSRWSRGMGWLLGEPLNIKAAAQVDRTVGNHEFSKNAGNVVKGGMRIAGAALGPAYGAMGETFINALDNKQSTPGGSLLKGVQGGLTAGIGGSVGGYLGGAGSTLSNAMQPYVGQAVANGLSGAVTGAGAGAITGGAVAGLSGQNIGRGALQGAQSGAIAGGIRGLGTGIDAQTGAQRGGYTPTIGQTTQNALNAGLGYAKNNNINSALTQFGLSQLNPGIQNLTGGNANANVLSSLFNKQRQQPNYQQSQAQPPKGMTKEQFMVWMNQQKR